jgi:polyisoprenyl-teichoic acid--peptidoglycan teichoic acid transferase
MRIPGWLFVIGIALFVGVTALLSFVAFSVARQVAIDAPWIPAASFEDVLQTIPTATQLLPITATIAPTTAPGETPLPTTPPQPTSTRDPAAEIADWPPGKFNILLLGIDQRTALNEAGPFLTDTMMVVSVDSVRKTAGILSIPRDLWVSIPGFRQGRINTANSLGDSGGYPGGGPALAAATVRQTLGIPVEKYILINFDVFITLVNTVAPDGTEICVREMIDDPDYPDAGLGTIAVHFDPGCQILDSEHLLQYARTRATQGSDFDRAARQQEVLRALRDKVLSVGGITSFIGQAPTLWDELTGSLKTNLTLDEILSLGKLVQDIPQDSIHFGVIDNLYVDLATTSSGDQVLVPKLNTIRLLIQQVFNPQDDLELSDLRTRADEEAASIVVFNNTDSAGLAGQTRDWLTAKGVTVTQVGNTPAPTNQDTVIHVYTGKMWTARYLAALLGISSDQIEPGADGLTDEDIAIVIGKDIEPLLSGSG